MKQFALLIGVLIVSLVAAITPPERETDAQGNCFAETGFCVTNPAFMEYFRIRGGVRIMGYPGISSIRHGRQGSVSGAAREA
jgi:hypothetical protein